MCEWLSQGEWCDVKLMCGGRTFSAHRAVLASVSTFLRRILLACSSDETPIFIVLPDFDLDAMSSVLYYIYNGEVVVQKEKLEMFLDIIYEMQIFVDSQYLPKRNKTIDYAKSNHLPDPINSVKRNTFTLGFLDSKNQQYINIKKGKEIKHVLLQDSLGHADSPDKLARCQNPSGERDVSLGNLKTPFGDRQRNSFLRDLYIETYPRNGNVNGLPAGVLAISNECYRAPSVLLTNANAKHLGADDILLEPSKKTGEHISHSPTVFHPHIQPCTRDRQDYGETSKGLFESSNLNFCPVQSQSNIRQFYEDKAFTNVWTTHDLKKSDSLYQKRLQERILSDVCVPSIDLSVTPTIFECMKPVQTMRNNKFTSKLKPVNNVKSYKNMESSGISKVAILNHVLDSPWSPRIPVNYKPFRRKVDLITKQLQLPQVAETICNLENHVNDNNNNVSMDQDKVEEVLKAVVIDDIKEPAETPRNIETNRSQDFKCTICNQVFTDSESISSHMRRHTTTARYTCGECGKTFSQLRNFKYHMSIHRGTREFAATCAVCGKYFNDRGYLSSHMKIHRNRKEYKCTLCPKSFNQRVAYNMHVRIHTGVKPHVCDECGKAFSRKMLLKQHQRTHSGERPYACPHCDKRFADRSNMTLHLRLHTGVKPFSCTLCPKSFTKKHHLKSHLNFHTGSKPYSCPRCKLSFTQSSNMRTHLKKCNAPERGSEGDSAQQT